MAKYGSILKKPFHIFSNLSYEIYQAFGNSPVGRMLKGYDVSSGLLRSDFSAGTTRRGNFTARRAIARAMEQNFLFSVTRRLIYLLLLTNLRTFGVFFLFIGVCMTSLYGLGVSTVSFINANWAVLFVGSVAILIGILFLLSDHSLGYEVRKSFFFRWLLLPVFGISEDGLKELPKTGKYAVLPAVVSGIAFGVLCVFTHPLAVLGMLVGLLVLLLVLTIPESGVLLDIILLPFMSYLPCGELFVLVFPVLSTAGYLAKLLRGNRAFRLEIQDFFVLLLLILFAFSAFTAEPGENRISALIFTALFSFYFMIVNSIVTNLWLRRCRVTLQFSGVCAAVFGIIQFILAAVFAPAGTDVFTLGRSVTAGFSDHNVYAYFLVSVLAFSLPSFAGAKRRYRAVIVAASALMVAAVAVSFVQIAWIALLLIFFVYLIFYERRYILYFLLGGGIFAVLIPTLGKKTFLSNFYMSHVPIARVGAGTVFRSVFSGKEQGIGPAFSGFSRLLFGLGRGGLEAAYPLLGETGSAVLSSSCNFWVAFLCEFGLLGLILLCLFFFFFLQHCCTVISKADERQNPLYAYTGICLLAGMLLLNFFLFTWHDPIAFSGFTISVSLISAGLRQEYLQNRRNAENGTEFGSAAADRDFRIHRFNFTHGGRR